MWSDGIKLKKLRNSGRLRKSPANRLIDVILAKHNHAAQMVKPGSLLAAAQHDTVTSAVIREMGQHAVYPTLHQYQKDLVQIIIIHRYQPFACGRAFLQYGYLTVTSSVHINVAHRVMEESAVFREGEMQIKVAGTPKLLKQAGQYGVTSSRWDVLKHDDTVEEIIAGRHIRQVVSGAHQLDILHESFSCVLAS